MVHPDLPDESMSRPNVTPTPNRWGRIRTLLKRVGLAIGAGLLIWQTWRAVGQISVAGLALPSWQVMGAALILAMLSHLTQMAGWREVMAGLGARLSWRSVMEGYMLSMLPRYIPGTVWGYLSRGQWFYDRAGVTFQASSISSIMEMGLIILSGLVFAAATYTHSLWAGLLVVIAVSAGYVVLGQVLKRLSLTGKWPLIPLPSLLKSFALYGLIWPLYGLIIAGLLSVTADLWRILIDYSYAFFFAWMGGLLAFFIPSGLGVREFALQSVLQTYGLAGPTLVVVPLLVRLATITSEILWLCVGLALKKRE